VDREINNVGATQGCQIYAIIFFPGDFHPHDGPNVSRNCSFICAYSNLVTPSGRGVTWPMPLPDVRFSRDRPSFLRRWRLQKKGFVLRRQPKHLLIFH
jgi:hypothetical protein